MLEREKHSEEMLKQLLNEANILLGDIEENIKINNTKV